MTNRAATVIPHSGEFIFGLFGRGGFAREVMPIVSESIALDTADDPSPKIVKYFVDRENSADLVNGISVISELDFFSLNNNVKYFNVAVGDSKLREKLASKCVDHGAIPVSIQSQHSIIYDHNQIGEGAILCAHTIITSNAKIGKFFHANIYAYVAHDCVIGDYVTFAPDVHCNGNVHIKDHAYIGTGAVIKQGSPSQPLIIGEGAIVGMGAVVTKDVAPFTTVVGNPARPLEKR